ncbi:MAG: hypothetical protein ACREQ5_37135, partial [Candidatus Dormibacteria bacterium]
RQAVLRVAAVCAGMTGCGVLLSWVRADSGSLTGPVLLHLAANSGGLVTAWAVTRLGWLDKPACATNRGNPCSRTDPQGQGGQACVDYRDHQGIPGDEEGCDERG